MIVHSFIFYKGLGINKYIIHGSVALDTLGEYKITHCAVCYNNGLFNLAYWYDLYAFHCFAMGVFIYVTVFWKTYLFGTFGQSDVIIHIS